jgi:protein LSM14
MQGPGQGPIGGGSKQGTPQPAPAQAAQQSNVQANQKPVEMSSTPVPSSSTPSTAPPPPVESKPSTAAATAPPQVPAQQPQQQKAAKKPTDSRIALPLAPNTATKPAAPKQAATPSQSAPSNVAQPSSYADATHAATAAVAAAMAKLGPAGQQQQQPPQQQQQQPQAGMNMDNLTQKVNQMRVQDAPIRGRGRGRGRGGPTGVRRESAHKPVEVPTEDYDFESANAKFKINKEDLVKEQIASGEPLSPQNGDTPDPISNGHTETEEVVIPAKPGAEKGYDKKSSFFDNISSDLKDRQVTQGEMIDGRAMRRDERNKNVDTFGQGSVDNGYRGGFRGRGRGGRGFSRGGPRGGAGFAPRGGGFESTRGGAPRGRGRGGAGEPTVV